MSQKDPMEEMIHDALDKSGLKYIADDRYTPKHLDFWLSDMDTEFEALRARLGQGGAR